MVCEINNTVYTLVNIYAPNPGQMEKSVEITAGPGCRDFNLVLDTSIDVKGPSLRKMISGGVGIPWRETSLFFQNHVTHTPE